ncbi:unnamed protein product [Camellia sinensis]
MIKKRIEEEKCTGGVDMRYDDSVEAMDSADEAIEQLSSVILSMLPDLNVECDLATPSNKVSIRTAVDLTLPVREIRERSRSQKSRRLAETIGASIIRNWRRLRRR